MTTHDSASTPSPVSPTQVTYAGTQQQDVEAVATGFAAASPTSNTALGQVLTELRARSEADRQANQDAIAQAASLQEDVPTRPGPDTGGAHYLGYSQDELHAMVNDRADPSAVNDQGQSFTNVGNGLVDIADRLHAAAAAADTSWQGRAAIAAAGFTTSLASWHGATGQGSQLAGNRLWQQSEGLARARAAMPAPVAQPTAADLSHAITAPPPGGGWVGPTARVTALVDQYVQAQDNLLQMARVAQQYDNHLGSNSSMPQFTTPSEFTPHPSSATGTSSGSAQGPGTHVPAMRPAPSSSAPSTTVTAGLPSASSGRPGTSSPRHQGDRPDGMSAPPGSTEPWPPSGPPDSAQPASTVPAAVTSSTSARGNAAPGWGVASFANRGSVQAVGFGAPAVAWSLVDEDGGVRVRPTNGGQEPIEPGSPDEPGEPWTGGRGMTGAAADEAAVARGAAGAQEVGETPIGPLGAGRGRRNDDDEHKRPSYLDEPDPNKLYGIEQRLAPPVIGEQ